MDDFFLSSILELTRKRREQSHVFSDGLQNKQCRKVKESFSEGFCKTNVSLVKLIREAWSAISSSDLCRRSHQVPKKDIQTLEQQQDNTQEKSFSEHWRERKSLVVKLLCNKEEAIGRSSINLIMVPWATVSLKSSPQQPQLMWIDVPHRTMVFCHKEAEA